jgi:hypothetical protein
MPVTPVFCSLNYAMKKQKVTQCQPFPTVADAAVSWNHCILQRFGARAPGDAFGDDLGMSE